MNKENNPNLVLTKRELFAAMLLQGFITATYTNTNGQCAGFTDLKGITKAACSETLSKEAVLFADGLIKELDKGA